MERHGRDRDDLLARAGRVLDAVALLDEGGVVRYISPSAERIHGYPAEEIEGISGFETIHDDDRPAARRAFDAVVAEPGASRSSELRMRHKYGGWRRVHVVYQNRLDDPNVRGIIGSFRDITESRDPELQLRRVQRMEAIGHLAGGIAHDFNNVLTAVQGHLSMALEVLPPDSPALPDIVEATRSAERAAELTRQLLAFSRRQVMRPEPLDLNEVIRDLRGMLRRVIGENITVAAELAADLGTVHADVSQIQQVLLNLCVNARDAMPEGGRLTLETRNEALDPDYVARFPYPVEAGDYVRVSVTDTGTGIPPDLQEHIYEPFFTTKGDDRGTGLGLSTAYGIIKQSGGYIWVYSEPGVGTTFKIYLPRVESPTGRPERKRETAPSAPVSPMTVLVVEDEEAIRNVVRRILTRAGHRVLEAGDAESATERANESDGPIDLVVSDVVLPGERSGREVAEAVRARHPGAEVLLMSGYPRDAVVRKGIMDQEVNFLEKPFTPEELLRAIDGAMGSESRRAQPD